LLSIELAVETGLFWQPCKFAIISIDAQNRRNILKNLI
jgi:hypothetical protein